MIRMVFFTKRSVLFVLLVSNAFNPALALEPKAYSVITNKQQLSNIELDIKNVLVEKGLDSDVAGIKSGKLFKNASYRSGLLLDIYNTPELFGSKEQVNNALANYALYNKRIDFSSYSSVVGLSQSILLKQLDDIQLNKIKMMVTFKV